MKYILLSLALLASCDPAYAAVFMVHGTTTPTYMGSSTDTKPVTEVKKGSIFIETDTRHTYWWTGSDAVGTSTDWVQGMQSVSIDSRFPGEDTNLNRIATIQKQTCTTYTADGVIKSSAGVLVSIGFLSGTAVSAIVYDNASAASGTKLFDNSAIGVTPTTGVPGPMYPLGGAATNGMYLDVANPGVVEICWL